MGLFSGGGGKAIFDRLVSPMENQTAFTIRRTPHHAKASELLTDHPVIFSAILCAALRQREVRLPDTGLAVNRKITLSGLYITHG
ncbi:MAG: hypothetical protein PHD48_08510 [Alphaproteobacteria bacterium]|nr:hypothetical protein [Alphaproteobacteria bacterium]